jgi:hypothetical protein
MKNCRLLIVTAGLLFGLSSIGFAQGASFGVGVPQYDKGSKASSSVKKADKKVKETHKKMINQ